MSLMAFLEDLTSVLYLVSRDHAKYDSGLTDSTKAPMILSVTGFFSIVVILVVLVRFYVRGFLIRRPSIDDYFLLLALVSVSI